MRAALLVVLLAAGENWNNPPKNLPANVEHRTFMSASMKVEVGYTIYLPAEYKEKPDKRYPVLYYLHGRGGTESSNLGAIKLLDAAIQEGKVPPMIYVHAMGGRNSGYVDAPDGSVMGETAIINELIPHIDATCRTIARKEGARWRGSRRAGRARCSSPSSSPGCSAR
jgi:endo-1,4-beta-xylanase